MDWRDLRRSHRCLQRLVDVEVASQRGLLLEIGHFEDCQTESLDEVHQLELDFATEQVGKWVLEEKLCLSLW